MDINLFHGRNYDKMTSFLFLPLELLWRLKNFCWIKDLKFKNIIQRVLSSRKSGIDLKSWASIIIQSLSTANLIMKKPGLLFHIVPNADLLWCYGIWPMPFC